MSSPLPVGVVAGGDPAQQPHGATSGADAVSTTITAEPKRIVTVGLTDQDSLLALGVVPVGTTEWPGNFAGAIGPWAQDWALTQEQYDTLSKIAPAVTRPKEYNDYGIPRQEATRTAGKVLGKSAEADRLVSDVEARFTKARNEKSQFAGASGLVATIYQGYFVYGTEDPRSRILTSLDLVLPGDLDQAIGNKFGGLPYVLDRLVPQLAAAVDNPAT